MKNQNEVLILYPRKLKWFLLFALSTFIFILSILYLYNIDDPYSTNSIKGLVFLFTILESAFVIYSAIRLLPSSSFLRLNKTGLEWQSMFYGDAYSWKDIGNFEVNTFGYVLFDVTKEGSFKSKLEHTLPSNLRNLRNVFGKKSALPETYGMPPKQLAKLLMRWKQKYS